jgi:hypothetical protein
MKLSWIVEHQVPVEVGTALRPVAPTCIASCLRRLALRRCRPGLRSSLSFPLKAAAGSPPPASPTAASPPNHRSFLQSRIEKTKLWEVRSPGGYSPMGPTGVSFIFLLAAPLLIVSAFHRFRIIWSFSILDYDKHYPKEKPSEDGSDKSDPKSERWQFSSFNAAYNTKFSLSSVKWPRSWKA